MRRVIDHKVYDTKHATMIGERSWGEPVRHVHYFHEILYQKKNGEFFMWGEGGIKTSYGFRTAKDEWSVGQEIFPCSRDDAKSYVRKHFEKEIYQKVFGELPE